MMIMEVPSIPFVLSLQLELILQASQMPSAAEQDLTDRQKTELSIAYDLPEGGEMQLAFHLAVSGSAHLHQVT